MGKVNRFCNAAAAHACLVFLLLLLPSLTGEGMVGMVEARTCMSQSHRFHGKCVSTHNCGMVCHNEGFPGGKCHGFRRRCFCVKPC